MNVLSHILLSKCDRKYQRKEASREYIYIYFVYQYFERYDLSFLGSYIQMTWSS